MLGVIVPCRTGRAHPSCPNIEGLAPTPSGRGTAHQKSRTAVKGTRIEVLSCGQTIPALPPCRLPRGHPPLQRSTHARCQSRTHAHAHFLLLLNSNRQTAH